MSSGSSHYIDVETATPSQRCPRLIQHSKAHYIHCCGHISSAVVIFALILLLVHQPSTLPLVSIDESTPNSMLLGKGCSPAVNLTVCDGVTLDDKLGVCSHDFMVSTSNEYATRAALEILRAGGNVVDAAAAAQLMLGLTQPLSAGIGGGCFVMTYNATTKKVRALDGREEAPTGYTKAAFCVNQSAQTEADCGGYLPLEQVFAGGMAVGIPGVLRATEKMLKDEGTMTFAQVAAPAIHVARNGYHMSQFMYENMVRFSQILMRFNATRALFFGPDGKPKATPAGLMYNEDYAATLELIARNGIDEFYTGGLAQEIVQAINSSPNDYGRVGTVSMNDMAGYRAVYRNPLSFQYRNFDIMGMNLPSSGPLTLGYILASLEPLDIAGSLRPGTAEYLHRTLDAQDLAFSDRNAWMADADAVDVPVEGLKDLNYIQQRAKQFLKATTSAGTPIPPGEPPGHPTSTPISTAASPEGPETSHMVVADAAGNIVSLTTTIQTWWGSGIVVPGRGFLLNNQLSDFERQWNAPNSPSGDRITRRTALPPDDTSVGGKRPRSSMTPVIVFHNKEPYAALGSSGGSTIIGGVLNVLLNVLEYNLGAQEAVDSPRAISRNNNVCLEPTFSNNTELVGKLQRLGFQLGKCYPDLLAVVQMVRLVQTQGGAFDLYGASDRIRIARSLAMGS